MFRVAALVLVGAVFAACSGDKNTAGDPRGRLKEYISRSFSVDEASDRGDLLVYLTGDARRRLTVWSDTQFQEAFIDSKREFLKLAFREVKPISPDEMNITYELTYLDKGRGKGAKITNRKLAQLVREKGVWMISGVKNIKELIEYQNEMSLP